MSNESIKEIEKQELIGFIKSNSENHFEIWARTIKELKEIIKLSKWSD